MTTFPEVPAATTDAQAEQVRANLRRARATLLGGRGPGASEAEVSAHTRNRVIVAGMAAARRLEMAARQTTRARGDAAGLSDVTQLRRAELADTVGAVTGHLRPGRRLTDAATARRTQRRARGAAFVLGAGAMLVLTRATPRPLGRKLPAGVGNGRRR